MSNFVNKPRCPSCDKLFNANSQWRAEGEPGDFDMDCPHCGETLTIEAIVTVEFETTVTEEFEDDEDDCD